LLVVLRSLGAVTVAFVVSRPGIVGLTLSVKFLLLPGGMEGTEHVTTWPEAVQPAGANRKTIREVRLVKHILVLAVAKGYTPLEIA
jgi:hypothetical protein